MNSPQYMAQNTKVMTSRNVQSWNEGLGRNRGKAKGGKNPNKYRMVVIILQGHLCE